MTDQSVPAAAPLTFPSRARVIEMLQNYAAGTYHAIDPEICGLAARYLQSSTPAREAAGQLVQCLLCVDPGGTDVVHVFSTRDLAESFAQSDPRDHVLYDYVIDCPERMETRSQ